MPWSNHEGPDLSSDFWKSTERNRAISVLRFFRAMGLMESGPDALLGFRLQSSFMMPCTDIVISGIGWYVLCSEGGTEWLPILSLSMPFCKTWVVSCFSDRGALYQLCPYFELPNFQNLASVGVQCLLSLVLNFFIRENSFLIENCD